MEEHGPILVLGLIIVMLVGTAITAALLDDPECICVPFEVVHEADQR